MAGTVIRELITKFGFDVDEDKLDGLDNALANTKSALTAIIATGAAAGATLVALTAETAAYADDAIKTAERIGLTVEELQALDFALGISGTSMEQQRASFVRLARTASDANEGLTTAQRAFDRIGVSVTDASGELKPMEALIRDVADGLSRMENETLRTATAQELFGRRGTDLLQFIEDGAAGINALTEEARSYGAIMSTEAAEGAEEFNDELLRARTVVRGVRQAIGLELIPEMTELITAFREWFAANREVIAGGILSFLRMFVDRARAVVRATWRIVNVFWRVVEVTGGLEANLERLKIVLIVLGTRILIQLAQALWATLLATQAAASGFTFAAAKAALMNAAIAFIPTLVAIAIVALGYLVGDFRRFFNGQDSLIGALAEKWASMEGVLGSVGRFILDLRDEGEIALQLMANDFDFMVQRVSAYFRRLGLGARLAFAEMKEAALDAQNAVARTLGIETLTDNVLNEDGEVATDALRRQLDDERRRATEALANRGTQQILLAEELRLRRDEERAAAAAGDVDASVSVGEINITGAGSPTETADELRGALNDVGERQRRETARQLGVSGG